MHCSFNLPIKNFVVNLSALLQDFLPANVKQLVNVPKTYQNMFSISSGLSIRDLRVCLSEKTRGIIPRR